MAKSLKISALSAREPDAFASIRPTKLNFYLRCMEKFGFSPTQVLAGTSLSKARLQDRYQLVEIPDYIRVVSNMMALTGWPDLAFRLGREIRPGDIGILGHAISACGNTAEGSRVWQKYNWLFFGNLLLTQESEQDGLRRFEYSPRVRLLPHLLQFFIEEKISVEVSLFKHFNQGQISSRYYTVVYPPPPHAALYEKLLGAPVTFNADSITFAIDTTDAYLDSPFPGADPETLEVISNYLDRESAAAYTHTSASARTRHLILEHFPRILSVAEMAGEFRWSSRTFCRNLEAEGTSYQQLLAKVREETAKNYLVTTALSVEDISKMLGFGDSGSLRRAFKTWSGMTISQYKFLSRQS